jgi:transcriptional regulator with XRE-family HTH domain
MIDPKVFKQVRKRLGLSQQELADALGLSRVTVNKMERGRLARGIPDEIGERLILLQHTTEVQAAVRSRITTPRHKLKHYGDRRRHDHAAEDDAHLWDNEEDD